MTLSTTRPERHEARRATLMACAVLTMLVAAPGVATGQGRPAGYVPLDSAPSTPALERLLTLDVTDELLRDVVGTVAREAGFSLVFDDSLPGLRRRVSIRAPRLAARRVLERALAGSTVQALVSPSGDVVLIRRPSGPRRSARIDGIVRDEASGEPVAGARVELVGTRFSAYTNDVGRFAFGQVPFGEYALRIMRLGFAAGTYANFRVPDDARDSVAIPLQRATAVLSEVVVTPGYFGLLQPSVAAPQTLTRQQLETVPQIGEDIYRAVTRLPGVSGDDFSAKFSVRGSSGDELYVSLDGLELVEPFHLRDVGGAFSIVDIQALGSASLTTGGFSAEYGDRLGGVFTLRSLDPRTDRTRVSLGLSLMNARATMQGGFASGRGGWLLSARPGYLDLAMKFTDMNDRIKPRYYDLFGKAQYDLANGGRVALHLLHADDSFKFDDGPGERTDTRYGSSFVWATWDHRINPRLRFQSVASVGSLRWHRFGVDVRSSITEGLVRDDRDLVTLGLRQDWSMDLSRRLLLKWGLDTKREDASYDYRSVELVRFLDARRRVQERFDSTEVRTAPAGSRVGAYLAPRVTVLKGLTMELGLRYDQASYTGEGALASPRFNLSWEPRTGTTFRGAWGRYTQSQPLFGLQVEDGVQTFSRAERAEQRVIGVEQQLPWGTSARLETYERLVSRRRPEYLNVAGDVDFLPELKWDHIRVSPTAGRDRGVELMLSRSKGERMDWSGSYALASSIDTIGGKAVPRRFDQRHTVHFDWALRPKSEAWRLTVGAIWHTGFPYTPTIISVDTLSETATRLNVFAKWSPGELHSLRLPDYRRIDMRWTRYFDTARGRVAFFGEVYNLFNSSNPRGYFKEFFISGRQLNLVEGELKQISRLPVVGMSWEF
jgi:hypothetical protein